MRYLLLCLSLWVFSLSATAQIKDQEIGGITVKSKRLDVRQILDSINKNAPANYAEPAAIAGYYKGSYQRGTDTIFGISIPTYLFKKEDGKYGELLRDTTLVITPKDNRKTKAHFDRTLTISSSPFPAKSSTMNAVKKLYEIENTDHILYGREGTDDDPYFYILFRPKKKKGIPLIARPFVSSIDKDSLLIYSLIKIRRKGWVMVSQESALLMATPATVNELIKTTSFARAHALIEDAKTQPNLRRYVRSLEWDLRPDGKYYFQQAMQSDNLLNISLALFKKFPDPGGYIGTAIFTADPQMPTPAKEVLKPYNIADYSKERGQYSGKD